MHRAGPDGVLSRPTFSCVRVIIPDRWYRLGPECPNSNSDDKSQNDQQDYYGS
jgi:hypothetical protein